MTDLAQVLRHLPPADAPELTVGSHPADDAAVYRMSDDLAMVQSLDFFTPIVDDPFTFGQIAAANSLSDIYAVGADPKIALNIAAFPVKTLPLEVLGEILRGGAEKAREAGAVIAGGHTVDDDEPKYGLVVTGFVDPRKVVTAHGARPGDRLILTKPLGTGILGTAIKSGMASPGRVEGAVRWMTTLNRSASRAMLAANAHACSDITGFGLLGHLHDLCRASAVGARVTADSVPLLPGAAEYERMGCVPGGTASNLSAVQAHLDLPGPVDQSTFNLLADPQTSGGLLIVLAPEDAARFHEAASDDMLTADVGEIVDTTPGRITVAG